MAGFRIKCGMTLEECGMTLEECGMTLVLISGGWELAMTSLCK